jgi:hypothetical protein
MHEKITGGRARWRGWPQGAAIGIVAVSIALLTAGCGGGGGGGGGAAAGSGASSSATTTYAKELAFAQCMRSHGVTNYPDPGSNGVTGINGSTVNLNSAQGQAAESACRHLLPDNGQLSQAQQQQNSAVALKFAQCMRSHGVTNYPDPGSNGATHISPSSGINPQSPAFQRAQQACQSIMPGQVSGGS